MLAAIWDTAAGSSGSGSVRDGGSWDEQNPHPRVHRLHRIHESREPRKTFVHIWTARRFANLWRCKLAQPRLLACIGGLGRGRRSHSGKRGCGRQLNPVLAATASKTTATDASSPETVGPSDRPRLCDFSFAQADPQHAVERRRSGTCAAMAGNCLLRRQVRNAVRRIALGRRKLQIQEVREWDERHQRRLLGSIGLVRKVDAEFGFSSPLKAAAARYWPGSQRKLARCCFWAQACRW